MVVRDLIYGGGVSTLSLNVKDAPGGKGRTNYLPSSYVCKRRDMWMGHGDASTRSTSCNGHLSQINMLSRLLYFV